MKKFTILKSLALGIGLMLITGNVWGQIAAWDFFGESSPATSAADVFNTNLNSSNLITRGPGAAASSASNSFRTTGFQNNGISTSNTDYFQITIGAATNYKVSLSTIDARYAGTAAFNASPGVTSQYAYSLDGTTFTLIGSPVTSTSSTPPTIDLTVVSALQNVTAGTTITIRYYASGQTTTGGWGYNSPSAGQYGLAIGGSVILDASTPTITVAPATLSGFTYVEGSGPSAEQTFTVEGSDLTSDITITPPVNYEISTGTGGSFVATNPITLTQSGGVVVETTIYVRLKAGLAVGTYNDEDITASSTGAANQTVTCSGSVTAPPPQNAVTFYVDMTNAGSFTNVDIAGDFNGWGSPITNLTLVQNNIYTHTTDAVFNVGDVISFKFRKDGSWDTSEPGLNREYTVVAGTNVYHAVYGVMVPAEISWANLQWPPTGNIDPGQEYNAYARVFANGLTGTQGVAPNLNAWIGYSINNTNPATWTNWIPAAYLADAGNNEEYIANIGSSLSPGTYYYASRFRLGLADYVYGGYHVDGGGFWDGVTNVSGELIVNAPYYFVDFEAASTSFISGSTGYASGIYNLNGYQWDLVQALVGSDASDMKNDASSARIRYDGTTYGSITMLEDKINGIGTISFLYARSNFSGDRTGNAPVFVVEYSTDDGLNWIQAGNETSLAGVDVLTEFNTPVYVEGSARIRIRQVGGDSSKRWNVDDILVTDFESPVATTFTNVDGFLWSTLDNWINGIPGATSNVIIAGQATVDFTTSCNNLTINNGGSIIDNNNLNINGDFFMYRQIPSTGWHMVSAPVSSMVILGSDFAPAPTGDPATLPTNFDLFFFDEGEDELPWINIRTTGNVPNPSFDATFLTGKGYLVAYAIDYPDGPFAFDGALNTGVVNIPLNYTGTKNAWTYVPGYNLIGNPYPSGIDWGTVIKTSLEDDYAYVYNNGIEDYEPQNNGTIAANQGFFVKVNSAGSLVLDNDVRVHGGTFTKEDATSDLLELNLANAGYSSKTSIRIQEGSEHARDRKDALKMFSFAPHMPQIYTYTSDQVRVAVNSIPEIQDNIVIPLSIKVPANGTMTLSIAELNGVFADQNIFLVDLLTNVTHNLSEQPEYSFTGNTSDSPDRFQLKFEAVGIPEVPGSESLQAWVNGNILYVMNSGNSKALVEVYNIQGQVIMSHEIGKGLQSLPAKVAPGAYIVRMISEGETATRKVVIQ